MKTSFRSLTMVLLSMLVLFAQAFARVESGNKADKKPGKMEMQQNKEKILDLINNHSFVIEANTLQDRRLNTYHVNSTTNFVKVDGNPSRSLRAHHFNQKS